MAKEGKYIYCIIQTRDSRNFGPIGIGNRDDVVSTVSYQDLSAVISSTPMNRYVINRENMTAHETVIETVMKDHTVLPVRFCTIAASTEDIRTLLMRRYSELKGLLWDMDNKVEMGIKVLWKDLSSIYQELMDENKNLRQLKAKAEKSNDQNLGIELGKAVKKATEAKKVDEAWEIIRHFKRSAIEYRENNLSGDSMVLNAAFLIDRAREKEFDFLMDDLDQDQGDRYHFKYVGPIPPFNFVNLVVEW